MTTHLCTGCGCHRPGMVTVIDELGSDRLCVPCVAVFLLRQAESRDPGVTLMVSRPVGATR